MMHQSYVYNQIWEPYVIMIVISALYGIAAIYFFKQRNKVSFLTRSPITVALSLFLLGLDSIMQTLIFSNITLGNMFHWQCNMSIMATVLGQFGFMLATGLRTFRVSKIY